MLSLNKLIKILLPIKKIFSVIWIYFLSLILCIVLLYVFKYVFVDKFNLQNIEKIVFKESFSKNYFAFFTTFTSLTNIFVFGVFSIRLARKNANFNVIYYSLAIFGKNTQKISCDDVNIPNLKKYKFISIYTHVGMIFLGLLYMIFSVLLKTWILSIIFILLMIILTIRFITSFSSAFMIKSARMINLKTLVYIEMYSQSFLKREKGSYVEKGPLSNHWKYNLSELDSVIKSEYSKKIIKNWSYDENTKKADIISALKKCGIWIDVRQKNQI